MVDSIILEVSDKHSDLESSLVFIFYELLEN